MGTNYNEEKLDAQKGKGLIYVEAGRFRHWEKSDYNKRVKRKRFEKQHQSIASSFANSH